MPGPVGSTCTAEKKSRKTTGMPSVRKRVSPLVNSMVISARSWAASGLTGPLPGSCAGTGPSGPAATAVPGRRPGDGRRHPGPR